MTGAVIDTVTGAFVEADASNGSWQAMSDAVLEGDVEIAVATLDDLRADPTWELVTLVSITSSYSRGGRWFGACSVTTTRGTRHFNANSVPRWRVKAPA